MNALENRVSAELTEETLDEIRDLLNQLDSKMNFLVGLTPTERMRYPKMDKDNKLFVQDALTAIEGDNSFLPAYIQPEEMEIDLQLFEQLGKVLLPVTQLYEKVRDTQILVGSEAYSTALLVYNMAKTASRAGLPGAGTIYNKLKERFEINRPKSQEN